MKNYMNKKNLKNLKGFTLVEVIVVMVIIAILAAMMIPSLTKYIDKANTQQGVIEGRSALTAAQTLASEHYGTTKTDRTSAKMNEWLKKADTQTKILELAELVTETNKDDKDKPKFKTAPAVDGNMNIVSFVLDDGVYEITYDKNGDELYTVVAKS